MRPLQKKKPTWSKQSLAHFTGCSKPFPHKRGSPRWDLAHQQKFYPGATPNCDRIFFRTVLQTTKLWASQTAKLCTSESRPLATRHKDFRHTHTHACAHMQVCPSFLEQKRCTPLPSRLTVSWFLRDKWEVLNPREDQGLDTKCTRSKHLRLI